MLQLGLLERGKKHLFHFILLLGSLCAPYLSNFFLIKLFFISSLSDTTNFAISIHNLLWMDWMESFWLAMTGCK